MDKKRSFLNVFISLAFKIIILFAEIFVRRFLINYVGNEANGLNSLFASILDFLSIAELGAGTAITYCMYKPIVEGDKEKTAALYHLFQKFYLIIGAVIFAGGCIVLPLLPILAKGYETANVNLYLTFALVLVSVDITYFYSAKTSLINAHKDNYITNTISSLGKILLCGMQLLVLFLTRSFVWYLVCRIIAAFLQWAATEIVARLRHGELIRIKSSVDKETKRGIAKNVKAMFMHKIGAVLVNAADSIIISSFIGIEMLGKYSNYTTIVVSLTGVLALCFSPLTSVVGHMFVQESKEQALKYFHFFHTLNFILGTVFLLGYFSIIDDLTVIFFKKPDLELARAITMVIAVNHFVQFMRQAINLFKDAAGIFYADRWKPLCESVVNVGLSILFVFIFPDGYEVVGVIAATIITNLFICHIVEPHVVFKYAFKTSAKGYYIRNYLYIAVFVGLMFALNYCMIPFGNRWLELLVNGCISLAFSLPVGIAAGALDGDFRAYFVKIFKKFKNRKKKEATNEQETPS